MRIALGTAQFGLPYGITNTHGQVGGEEVRKILRLAADNGVHVLDTAAAYGNSECVLGLALKGDDRFQIITKLAHLRSQDTAGVRAALDRFTQSLVDLRVTRVHGLLVHRYDDLAGPVGRELFDAIERRRADGEVEFIGASVYAPEEAFALVERFPLDIVQLPSNILDQRAASDGLFDRLSERGVSVHVRSAFLQGVLAADSDCLPLSLPGSLLAAVRRIDDFAARHAMTKRQAALGYIKAQPIDVAVIGVTAASELADILSAWNGLPSEEMLSSLPWSTLTVADKALIDPRLWMS